jgi:hypothetical protein
MSMQSRVREKGLTIVQTMVLLFVLGIVGTIVVNYVIDKRCEAEPAKQMCSERGKTK